jgi:hypothetical protein
VTNRDKKDILQVLRDLLKHRTDDLGSYEFVLESWIEDAAAEIDRLRAMMPIFRDTFAAAALTGLLAAPTDKDRSMDYWARLAYEAADAMLRERERTTHDAAPEATASVPLGNRGGRGGTDKPVTLTLTGGRVGTILSEAEIDALEYVVEEGRIASMDDYGVLRSLLIRVRPEWEAKP